MQIDGREISNRLPPYLVAELSCNHSGEIQTAKKLILEAKTAGADAVKLQTYTPDELTTKANEGLWKFYDRLQTPRAWHQELFSYAKELGITIFSTPFSVDGVRFLEGLNPPAYKIASAEWNDLELINAALATGKPVIISTGMASGPPTIIGNVVLLHCVSQYPARVEDANLNAIASLRINGNLVGLSDHTPGYETAIAATALGAVMIEKHFKLDDNCMDHQYSLDPWQFRDMCKAVRAVWTGMGDGVIKPTCKPRQR